MSTVWEDIDVFAKQYMWDLAKYLLTLLSYSYGIIMDHAKKFTWSWKKKFDGLNAS